MPTRVTSVKLQADISSVVRGLRTTATEAGSTQRAVSSLERELDRLGKTEAKPNITLVDAEAKERLEALQKRLADLGRTTSDARVGVDDAALQTKLSRIEAQLLAVANQSVDPTIDLGGIAAAEAKLGALEAELSRIDGQTVTAHVKVDGTASTTKSFGLLVDTVAMLGPAAVAAGGAASGAVLGIGAAATTAGVAFGGLALTVKGQLTEMTKQKKAIEAASKHLGTLTKGTADYRAQVQQLNQMNRAYVAQFGAAADAVDHLKASWNGYLTDVGNGGVNNLIADAANLASQLLPKIEGMVEASAGSVRILLQHFSDFAKGPEAAAMLAFFQKEGPAAIEAFGAILGPVGKGLISLLMAFTPLAHGMAGGLQEVAQGFAAWAANLPETQGFQEFMDYVNRVGPKLWDTLGAVAQAFIAISTAAAPVGEATLPIIKELADMLAELASSPAGPAIFGIVAAFAALNRVLVTVAALKSLKVVELFSGMGSSAAKAAPQIEGATAQVQSASKAAFAAKAGFVAAGIGLEVMASHLDESNEGLKDVATVLGGAAIGAAAGPWGAAIGAAAGALQVFTQHSADAAAAQHALDVQAGSVADTLNKQTGAITNATTAALRKSLADSGAYDAANTLRVSYADLTKAAQGYPAAQKQVQAAIEATLGPVTALPARFRDMAAGIRAASPEYTAWKDKSDAAKAAASLLTGTINAQTGAFVENRRHIMQQQSVIAEANLQNHPFRASTAEVSKVMDQLGRSASDTATKITAVKDAAKPLETEWQKQVDVLNKATTSADDYKMALDGLINTDGSAFDAQRALNQSYLDAKAGLKQNGTSLDENTTKGNANIDMVEGMINHAKDYIVSQKEAGKSPRFLDRALENQRQTMIKNLTQMGFNKKAVSDLIDTYGLTPHLIDTLFQTKGIPTAKDDVKGMQDKVDYLDKSAPVVTVAAATEGATRDLENFVTQTKIKLGQIPDEPVKITLSAQATKVMDQLGIPGQADGGPVYGPGGPRDDKVLRRLSNGERVNTAEVITRAGKGDNRRGQAVMAGIERMILRGELGRMGDVPAMKDGGPVSIIPGVHGYGLTASIAQIRSEFDAITAQVDAELSRAANKRATYLPPPGYSMPGGGLSMAQVARGQRFAMSQVGLPYVWGGTGGSGWDCSGFVGGVGAAAVGLNPYQRYGTSASAPNWPGWASGTGSYTAGYTPNWEGSGIGHVAGTIGNMNVESYGGHGPAVGSGARGALDPHWVGHMKKLDTGGSIDPGWNHIFNGLPHSETAMVVPQSPHSIAQAFGGGGQKVVIVKQMLPDKVTLVTASGAIEAIVRREAKPVATSIVKDYRNHDSLPEGA